MSSSIERMWNLLPMLAHAYMLYLFPLISEISYDGRMFLFRSSFENHLLSSRQPSVSNIMTVRSVKSCSSGSEARVIIFSILMDILTSILSSCAISIGALQLTDAVRTAHHILPLRTIPVSPLLLQHLPILWEYPDLYYLIS